MKWAHAVKLWNAHGKIYNPRHVYAIPRKGTAEHADVKHIQQHDELPAHLKKKGPFPAEALAQLQALAKESEARREVARQAPKEEAKPKKKRKAKAPIEIEEAEPEIAVPVSVEAKKPKRDMSKILAGILAEAKKRKASVSKPDLLKFDVLKELGEDSKEPKKEDTTEKLRSQYQRVKAMKGKVLGLLKQANDIEDFSKRQKPASHIQKELYKVDEILDLINEEGERRERLKRA